MYLYQMLNSDGGIETDLTVVCISENNFRIIEQLQREKEINSILKNTLIRM